MIRGQAARISAAGATVDVGDVTTRYLLYGLLPGWFVPGLADWAMHRRTRIEDTAGSKESLILPHCPKGRGGTPTLMMAEVGLPIALTLRYEVNPLLLTVQLGGAAVHEATALWDVKTAVDSDREVKPVEQHIHSFLESLPFAALAALMCLHADQVRAGHWRAADEATRTPGGWCHGGGRCPPVISQASAPRSPPVCCCRTARSCCAVRALPEQGKSCPGKDVEPSCVSRF